MRACDGTKRAIVVSRFLASLTLTRPNGLVLTRAARRRVQHLLGVLPQVSKRDSPTSANSRSRILDATQKIRMMLEPIVEPIVFRPKSDQDASGATVPRDDDFLVDREPEVFGKVILHFRQSHFFWSLVLACLLDRATTALWPS